MTVANAAGRGTAYGVAIVDDLPDPFVYAGAPVAAVFTPAACGVGPSPLTGTGTDPAALGTAGGDPGASYRLDGGCSVALSFDVSLNGAANGTYQNPAQVLYADPTRSTGNSAAAGGNPTVSPGGAYAIAGGVPGANYDAAASTAEDVIVGPDGADLVITQGVTPQPARVGETVTITLTLRNDGVFDTTGVVVRDLLPAGLSHEGATASRGTYVPATGVWEVGDLDRAETVTLQIVALVNAVGSLVNTAEVTASAVSDPDSANNVATVTVLVADADLSLSKTGPPGRVRVGQTVNFTLTVANAGPSNASNVRVSDVLPAGFTFVAASPPGSYDPGTGVWNVPALDPGASTSLEISARVNPRGPYLNTAEITAADQPDVDSTPGNGDVTEDDLASYEVQVETADLRLSKTVAPGNVDAGGLVTFTLQVVNAGPDAATGMVVRDLLPSGYQFIAQRPSAGGSYDAASGLWQPGSLAQGATATLQIDANVLLASAGTARDYTNVAEVMAAEQTDPNSIPGNGITTEDDYASATPIVAGGQPPVIGAAKAARVIPVSPGVFDVEYRVRVQNLVAGSIAYDLQVRDDLAAAFPAPASFSVSSAPVADSGLVANAGFNGSTDTNLLNGSVNLVGGTPATIIFTVRVTANGLLASAGNTARATAATLDGGPVTTSDDSAAGENIDANGNGNPGDAGENEPTAAALGGSVSGRIFLDLNGNGVQDTGESGLAGVVLQILGSTGPVTVTTQPGGVYSAVNVAAGAVTVDVVEASLPTGAVLTAGTDPTIFELRDGEGFSVPPTGFQQQGTLALLVFNDVNGNGVRDAGDNGLAAAQLRILEADGTDRVVVTLADGTLSTGVPIGNTQVDVLEASLPPGSTLTLGTDPVTLIVAAGATVSDTKGFQTQGTLSGRVFRDNNGNGVQDAGEPGFPDLPVLLTPSVGEPIGLVTNTSGDFSRVVPAGRTSLRFSDPAGFSLTTANREQSIAVDGGVAVAAAPVGYAAFASVGGSVWRDLDSDRQRDANEPGLSGWRVELIQAGSGTIVQTASSDASGQYSLLNVVPAQSYRLRFRSPNGAVYGVGVNGENANAQPDSTVDAASRSLEIRPQPGASLTQQSLPVDPQGLIYDTLNRATIEGAIVTLAGPTGFDPATHLLGGASNASQTTLVDGAYQFLLLPGAPPGNYTLSVTPPTGYSFPSTFLLAAGTLDPTNQGVGGLLRVQSQATPPTGAEATTYYLSLDLAPGDPDVVNNHVPLDPPGLSSGAVRLTKRADRATATIGSVVSYTITLENTTNTRLPGVEVRDIPPPGFTLVERSLRLDGSTIGVTMRGTRPMVLSGIDLEPRQRRTLRYVLRVSAGVVRGEYPNTAGPFLLNTPVGNSDTARVAVVADPVFDETTIIGKVFNDLDGDGWQDEGESGVPGVRLATVEGLVVETDAFGRYHLSAIDGGRMERGRNFIVKLDAASLPPGSTVTTENPRVARITSGAPSRFDFGVRLLEAVVPGKRIDLKLAEIYFARDSAALAPEFLPLLTQLADRVRAGEKARITVKVAPPSPEGCMPGCQLGRRRIDTVRRELGRLLGPEALKNVEIVADYTAAGGVARGNGSGSGTGAGASASGWLARVAYAALSLLAAPAQAAACPSNICETQPVEVRGRYERTLPNPGRFWVTEDASALVPQLAAEGPDRLAQSGGVLEGSARFWIYTNYSSFIERFEVQVFAESDASRSRPLAVLPVAFLPNSLRNLLAAQWDTAGTRVAPGTALMFVVRAIGRDGKVDETLPRRISIVSRNEYAAQARVVGETTASRALRNPSGAYGEATQIGRTALGGRYLMLVPGSTGEGLQGRQLLLDPEARVAVDAAPGLAAAESGIDRGQPLGTFGVEGSLPRPFTRKSLLGELETLDDSTLQLLYGRSDLALRSIAVRGSRVRLVGQGVDQTAAIRLNGQVIPTDSGGDLAYETLLPIGPHDLYLDVVPAAGDVWPVPLRVDVSGKHMFIVGLADLTWQKNDLSGSIEPLSADDRYLEESLAEGRVAVYLKGKIRGKYLLTAQLDSREEELGDLLGALDDKDPRRLFRSIDPDQYYPVYGDDSTTIADTNTQGRLYVRVEWDKSRAVLGNFNTNITGTEFAEYNRSLYGATVDWSRLETTANGDSRTRAMGFVSEAQTALGHDEFLGTGGSLYYLRHTDVVEGSAKLRIDIVDKVSERILQTSVLVEGVDYEIDELQGRILLAKPLLQVARQQAPSLVRESVLDGNQMLLVADYEYLPLGFDPASATFGARGQHWLNDHVAVGGTYVDESRDTQDYKLGGADLTLQATRGTYLKLEFARTAATQSARYFSADGGLSFSALNARTPESAVDDRGGEALGAEARVSFRDLGMTEREVTVAAWWKRNDGDFAVARRDEGFEVERVGIEAVAEITDSVKAALRANSTDRGGPRPGLASSVDQVSLQASWQANERDRWSVEIQQLSQQAGALPSAEASTAAVEYARRFNDRWDAYAIAQADLGSAGLQAGGSNLLTLGSRYVVSDRWTVDAEASAGDLGEGLSGTLEYRMNERHSLYGTFSHSLDRTDSPFAGSGAGGSAPGFFDNTGSTVALGSRWQVSDQTRVFNEAQFSDSAAMSGIGHVFGLEFALREGWRAGLALQRGEFDIESGAVDRNSASVTVGFSDARFNFSGRLEYRGDSGASEATQYLSSNRFDWRLGDAFRLLGKANYSQTEQEVSRLNTGNLVFGQPETDARFAEASIGVAYRPVDDGRLNWLARVTYLYDLASFGQASFDPASEGVFADYQSDRTDQKSLVASMEGVYRLTQRVDLGGKIARRTGEVRLGRASGDWIDSTVDFAAVRVSYEVISKWDAMVEYRVLKVPEASSTRKGFLVSIDRELRSNFKVGVGYNFTDFSDDLTALDYRFRGVFVNVVGKY